MRKKGKIEDYDEKEDEHDEDEVKERNNKWWWWINVKLTFIHFIVVFRFSLILEI